MAKSKSKSVTTSKPKLEKSSKPEPPKAKGPTTEGACSLFIEAFLKAHLKDEKAKPNDVAEKAGIVCSASVKSTVSYVTRRVVASLRKMKLLQS